MSVLQEFQPETPILMIGDNDIRPTTGTSYAAAAHTIVENLFSAILAIQSAVPSIHHVFLPQLLPRHPGRYFQVSYNEIALYINNLLFQAAISADQRFIRLFRFRDFCFPQENFFRYNHNHQLYRRDGTHITSNGYRRLERAMRAVVVASLNP